MASGPSLTPDSGFWIIKVAISRTRALIMARALWELPSTRRRLGKRDFALRPWVSKGRFLAEATLAVRKEDSGTGSPHQGNFKELHQMHQV